MAVSIAQVRDFFTSTIGDELPMTTSEISSLERIQAGLAAAIRRLKSLSVPIECVQSYDALQVSTRLLR